MTKTTLLLAVLLVNVLNAGCMYTINGNPDVDLTTVRVSPIALTLPLLDSGDNTPPLTFLATVTGAGQNVNLSWVSVAKDSIQGLGQSAVYYLGHNGDNAVFSDSILVTSTTNFSRGAKIRITYTFPNDVPFVAVPMDVTLLENSSMQFVIDTIHGHTISNVAWSVVSGPGTITPSGLYIAPSSVGRDTIATVVAKSGNDTSTATVHILQATDSLKCFSRDVQPILQTCGGSGCHGGGGNRPAFDYNETMRNVKPENARASRLYQIITELNANDRMPPPPSPALTPQQILMIGQWIDQGTLDCE